MASSFSARSPAGSPPAPANAALPNPRKRPSMGGPNASAKRRKPSTFSIGSSNHPLRQTSFPPEESAILSGPRSPSVDTDIARSVVTSVTGGKRGKKRKSAAPEGSVKSGRAVDAGKGADAESKADGDEGEDDEGDEDDEDDAELVEGHKQAERDVKRRLAVLYNAADEEQKARLETARVFHLPDAKVRRIVNQTLSQSVPKSVILAINSYTKQFVGELIERALDVQRQNQMAVKGYPSPEAEGQKREQTETETDPSDGEKEEPIGPLVPDSLREALRRIKRDSEMGGAGMEGVSLGLGIPGAKAASLGGRRLFR